MRYPYHPRNYFENYFHFVPYKNAYRALRLFTKTESNINNNPGLYHRYTENVKLIAKNISKDFFEMKGDFMEGLIDIDLYVAYLTMYRTFLSIENFYTVAELNRTDIEDELNIYIPTANKIKI